MTGGLSRAIMPRDPHKGQPIFVWGADLDAAAGALILLHGRGGSVDDMRTLAAHIERPQFACIAPAAQGKSWYPYSLLEPLQRNAGSLNSALRIVKAAHEKATAGGVPIDRVVLVGVSQGACVVLEFAARNARRYGGIVALSGALMGPEGTPRDYPGTFDGTPVFLGSGDIDPHVPKRRVAEAESVFKQLGANVTKRIYSGLGHVTNDDEVVVVRAMLDELLAAPRREA